MDFTATSKINLTIVYKCNDSLVDPQNLIRKMHHWAETLKIFSLENYPLYGIMKVPSMNTFAFISNVFA